MHAASSAVANICAPCARLECFSDSSVPISTVQADAPFVNGVAAGVAARRVERELALVAGEARFTPGNFLLLCGCFPATTCVPTRAVFIQQIDLLFGRGMRLLALGAKAPRQALRQDPQQRIGEVERVHAHIQQPHDGFRRAVGMQRGEHQVAGKRGFDADRHRFLVAHLTHHDDPGRRAETPASPWQK
jgi:hypothetical protein